MSVRHYVQAEVDRLVAAEREECAKACAAVGYKLFGPDGTDHAAVAFDCAEAIRARGAAPQEEGR